MKIIYAFTFTLLLLSLVGCRESNSRLFSQQMTNFYGRTASLPPIYRARIPAHWIQNSNISSLDLQDTTKPIAEFRILNEKNESDFIRLTIHNFPKHELSTSITPASQVTRWQKQFTKTLAIENPLIHESYAGFTGLFFERSGIQNEKAISILAWAMSLAPSHDSILRTYQYYHPEKAMYINEMRADYTIKALGNPSLMQEHRQDIINFAHSFELIEEIPTPL